VLAKVCAGFVVEKKRLKKFKTKEYQQEKNYYKKLRNPVKRKKKKK
jgi:hypothetical protein